MILQVDFLRSPTPWLSFSLSAFRPRGKLFSMVVSVSVSVSLVVVISGKVRFFPWKTATLREREREHWERRVDREVAHPHPRYLKCKKNTQDNWLLSLGKSASSPIYPNTQQEKNRKVILYNSFRSQLILTHFTVAFSYPLFPHDIRLELTSSCSAMRRSRSKTPLTKFLATNGVACPTLRWSFHPYRTWTMKS